MEKQRADSSNAGVDATIIDTAHGHTQGVVNVLKEVRNKFPQIAHCR
jgi:IMP dehydrogenase